MKLIKTLLLVLICLIPRSSTPVNKLADRPEIPLTCQYSKKIFALAVENHIDFKKRTPTLEKRVLKSLIYRIDPGKSLALENEISTLENEASKASLFSDIDSKCQKIIPKFYSLSLKISKRFTEKVIKITRGLTHKEIDDFKISKREKKYEKHAPNLQELDRRIRISTLKLLKYLKATDLSFKTLKKNFLKESQKALTKINKRIKESSGSALEQHEKYEFILSAFISALDAHSTYIPYSSFMQNEEEFNRGFFFGIGILIGKEKFKGIKVKEVYKNGPAGKEGTLKAGDIIYKVNGTSVIDLPLEDGVKLIKGPRGTKVKLDLIRTAKKTVKKISITLVRNKVFFTESIKVQLLKKGRRKIAVIELDTFFRNAANGVYQKYLANIGSAKIDGILLDLSRNGGGLLTEAIELTDHFIDRGPVVATKNAHNKVNVLRAKIQGELAKRVPMVLLVNKISASASEIVAGALKDYNRAIIVGNNHTFGKGSVQDVRPILGGKLGGIHITIAKFFRPKGKSTQLKGVSSDIIIPGMVSDDFEGEKDQLFPVSFETIPPLITKKDQYNFRYDKFIDKIAQLSKNRVKNNKIFAELEKDRTDIDFDLIEREKPFLKEGIAILCDYIELSKKQSLN